MCAIARARASTRLKSFRCAKICPCKQMLKDPIARANKYNQTAISGTDPNIELNIDKQKLKQSTLSIPQLKLYFSIFGFSCKQQILKVHYLVIC